MAFYFECHKNLPQTFLFTNSIIQAIRFSRATKRHYIAEFKHYVIQRLFNARLTLEQALQFSISNSGVVMLQQAVKKLPKNAKPILHSELAMIRYYNEERIQLKLKDSARCNIELSP